jgi:phage baseplate assembly protein W
MAILDKSKSPWVADRDDNQFIGVSLPLEFDGNNPTKTTLEAVKQNVLNLCSTERGERFMQPGLGLELRRYLFEPFSSEIILQVQDVIIESMNYWLPFIIINNIKVKMSDNESGDFKSVMEISIDFSLKKDATTTESVDITVEGE